jgi:multiple sugar transport system permease protein
VSWGQKTFVGLQNFRTILSEGYLLSSALVTMKFFVGLLIITQGVAFVIAYWLSGFGSKFQGFCLTFYQIPGVFTAVSTVVAWRWFYRYPDGLFNSILGALHLPGWIFLANPTLSAWAIIFAMAGMYMSGSMILWIAAIAQIPKEVIEAARLDGAGSIRILWSIVSPLTNRMRLYLLITNLVGAAHIWEHPYFFTGGGPAGSSSTLMYRIYELAFEQRRVGEGMAITIILIVVTVAIAAIFMGKLRDVLE